MPIDTWFPLAVYYDDLFQAQKHKKRLLNAVKELFSTAKKQPSPLSAWTGHGLECIHQDPMFSWIIGQVEMHTWKYIEALGHDCKKMDLYFQRSWPVVSKKGQEMEKHAHYTANISAIYYISSPRDGDSGCVCFLNTTRQNELVHDLERPINLQNELNNQEARYEPREGRLLIFPSKQIHYVEPNQTSEDRISLAFDMTATSRLDREHERDQFLPPPPQQWRRFKRDP